MEHCSSQIDFSLPIIPTSIWITVSMALLVAVFIMGGFYVQANLSKMLIQVRKSWSLLLLYLIVVTGMIFIDGDDEYRNWIADSSAFRCFPFSRIFLSYTENFSCSAPLDRFFVCYHTDVQVLNFATEFIPQMQDDKIELNIFGK